MRILFVGNSLGEHVIRPMDFLLREGHEVFLLGANSPWPEGREGFTHIFHPEMNDSLLPALLRVKQLFSPHIVHVNYADWKVFYCVKAAIAPVVIFVFGSDINEFICKKKDGYTWRRFRPKRWDLRWALPKAAHILVHDTTMIDKCRFIAPDCAPITLINLGVDLCQFRPPSLEERASARALLGFEKDDIVLLSPRILKNFYNHHIIVEQFALIAGKHKNAKLLVKQYDPGKTKENMQYAESIVHKAQQLLCASQIRFIPAVEKEHLHKLYWAVDGVVNYPLLDSFPVLFAETAACHVPLLTIRHPSYEGTFALKYAHSTFTDAFSLGKAMDDFFKNPQLASEQLNLAYQDVLMSCNHAHFCQKLLKIYVDVSGMANNYTLNNKIKVDSLSLNNDSTAFKQNLSFVESVEKINSTRKVYKKIKNIIKRRLPWIVIAKRRLVWTVKLYIVSLENYLKHHV